MSTEVNVTKDKLISDVKVVIADAEELLKATAHDVSEKAVVARKKIEENLKVAKAKLADAEQLVLAKTKQAAKVTDAYVHDNPWQAVGVAAGVGFLVGLLLGRRD